jgi:putative transposase
MMINRKITYKLYPNQQQTKCLLELLASHQRVYNAALEERIRIYRATGKLLSFANQCKILTQWRHQIPSLKKINAQSLQVTLKRLDLAFQDFFRRVKTTEKSGFPRFKSLHRFPGWGYKTHGDGWRLLPGEGMQHGKLRLSGVGFIKMRGKARVLGEPKTAEILHKSGKWYISVTIECQPKRTCGTSATGMDWGVERFLVLHNNNHITHTIENPRHLKKMLPKVKSLQRSISKKKKGSKNRKKAVKILANEHLKITNRRKNFHHQIASQIVKENGLIAVEALSIKSMTANGGNRKKGLNREILSTAPTQFHALLKSKAEEAGAIWVEIPTKKVKPSQTCHRCSDQEKKTLSERWHSCDCGANCSRDENAARVILNWALNWASGQELAEVRSRSGFAALKHETSPIPQGWRE